MRPRTENTLTLEDRHAYRLIRDLFDHKEAIFGELKRQSSTLAGSNSQRERQRAVSNAHVNTDESSRREKMEARAKAISEARRDRSPNPTNRHRRDKSTDGSNPGRFPVVASPRPDRPHDRTVSGAVAAGPTKRSSLEVPGSENNSPSTTRNDTQSFAQRSAATHLETPMESNTHSGLPSPDFSAAGMGMSAFGGPGPHIPPPREDDSPVSDPTPPQSAKEDNGKSGVGSLKRMAVKSGGSGSLRGRTGGPDGGDNKENESAGVQLTDKPMDDFS